jgi:hypothetical protein
MTPFFSLPFDHFLTLIGVKPIDLFDLQVKIKKELIN